MKNIRIFGDSVLKGVTYVDGGYHICKDKINIESADFCNFSKMGATTETALQIIDRKIDRCDENTIAVLEFGGNDCNYDWAKISDEPDKKYDCTVIPKKYTENFTKAIKKLKAKGATVIISSLMPISANKFMSFISNGLSYSNILKWLGDVETLSRWQAYYNNLALSVAEENGCLLMPLRENMEKYNCEELLCADGIHPTEEGHKVIHRFLENYLMSLI